MGCPWVMPLPATIKYEYRSTPLSSLSSHGKTRPMKSLFMVWSMVGMAENSVTQMRWLPSSALAAAM